MRITTELIKKLVKDIENEPSSWLRIQDWLIKRFDHGRVGLCVFGKWPYILELDASQQQKGNLDKLTWHQSWLLRQGRQTWLKAKHGGIHESLADWHKKPNLHMEKWVQLREQELLTKGIKDNEAR